MKRLISLVLAAGLEGEALCARAADANPPAGPAGTPPQAARAHPPPGNIPRILGHKPAGTFFFVQTNADGTLSVMENQASPAASGATAAANSRVLIQNKERPQFRIDGDSAVAKGGCHTVSVLGNLNDPGAITVRLLDGQKLVGTVSALALTDGTRQVWLGQVQDCTGVILPPPHANQVLWANAFKGIQADVLATYEWTSFEVDVILREGITLPEGFGPDTRISVWHEYAQAPEPRRNPKPVKLRVDPDAEARHGAVQDTDEELDFGKAKMIEGFAFATPAQQDPNGPDRKGTAPRVPVAKSWLRHNQDPGQGQGPSLEPGQPKGAADRRFLIETADFLSLKPALDKLGPPKTASLGPARTTRSFLAGGQLPAPMANRRSRTPPPTLLHSQIASAKSQIPRRLAQAAPPTNPLIHQSTNPDPSTPSIPESSRPATALALQSPPLATPGVCLDYILVNVAAINVNFGGGGNPKVGPAAAGLATNDFWNVPYSIYGGAGAESVNLLWSDQTPSGASLQVFNIGWTENNYTGDRMFDSYYRTQGYYDGNNNYQYGGMWAIIDNVPSGIYDVYVYGHGSWDAAYAPLAVLVINNAGYGGPGGGSYCGSTGIGAYGTTPITNWVEYGHYVVARGMRVLGYQHFNVSANENDSGNSFLNGLQLVATVTNSPPAVEAGPAQTNILASATQLLGYVTDDGFPGISGVSTMWSKISGPGTVSYNPGPQWVRPLATFSATGTYVLRLTADDQALSAYDDVVVTVVAPPPPNTPPTISAIPNQFSANSTPLGPLAFTIGDAETPAGNLTLQANSSNPAWIPLDHIVFGGSGSNRTVTVTPTLPPSTGWYLATIGLTVTDGTNQASTSFTVETLRGAISMVGRPLMNFNFGGGNKVGPAAVGCTTNDVWNLLGPPSPVSQFAFVNNALWSDGSASSAWLQANSVTVGATNSTGDAMYDSYFANGYDYSLGQSADIAMDLSLPPAFYDIYLYGHGITDDAYSDFEMPGQGILSTGTGPYGRYPVGTNWMEGRHYVVFRSVRAQDRQLLRIFVRRHYSQIGQCFLNGMQLVEVATNSPPTVEAGPDQYWNYPSGVVLGSATDDGLPNNTMSFTWSKIGGPGTVTFNSPNSSGSEVTFSAPGAYTLRLTASDSQLLASDDVVITVNAPPVITVKTNQVLLFPGPAPFAFSVADDGLPAVGGLSVQCSQYAGPGSVWFSGVGVTGAIASFSAPGYYTVRLSASDSILSTFVEVPVIADTPPTISGLTNQVVVFPNPAALQPTSTDDGIPENAPRNYAWSQVSGPGTTTFSPNATYAWPTATFSVPGTYTLRLAVDDTLLTNYADVVIISDTPPAITGLTNQTIVFGNSASLVATVTDDGVPSNAPPPTAWSKVSGPGTVTFTSPNMAATMATFSAPGWYTVRLTANDSLLTNSADVAILANDPPSINMTTYSFAQFPQPVTVYAGLNDYTLPPGVTLPLQPSWSKVSGPGTVTFAPIDSSSTSMTFSAPGAYVLRVTASDSLLSSSADIVIESYVPPTISEWTNQIVSLTNSATLSPTVVDDGLPSHWSLGFQWSVVSAPVGGSVAFSSPNASQTSATFSAPGWYTLRLTASRSWVESVSGDVVIGVNTAPIIRSITPAFSGAYTNAANLSAAVTDDGVPGPVTLGWSQVSGPGTATFSSPNQTNTMVTFSAPGTYTLRLSASDSYFTTTADVVATLYDHGTTISSIPTQITDPGVAVGPIAFTIGDPQTLPSGLWLDYSSSNPGLVNVAFGGSGSSRSVTLNPVPGRVGITTITVYVLGGLTGAATSFDLIVGDGETGGVLVGTDTVTQGDWIGKYGGQGFKVVGDQTSYPSYVTVSEQSIASLVWSSSTSESRALQRVGGGGRVAACDYRTTQDGGIAYNLNFTDSQWHQVALYALDWQRENLQELIYGPGADTWLPDCTNGVYAVFCFKGSAWLMAQTYSGPPAMASGLFFDSPSNAAPVIAPIANQTIIYPGSVSLSASATDDGLPVGGSLSYSWSQYSGPGTVTFSNPSGTNTTASFSALGTYILRLRVSDSQLWSSKYVRIIVDGDTDNDGLPDSWELYYFGDLSQTAGGDYNGDGITNLQHYQNHTDPTALLTDPNAALSLQVYTPLKK